MWMKVRVEIEDSAMYLKKTPSHRKDPPDHLQGLAGVRQEGQPAEGKSHQHSCSNSHQQEKPAHNKHHILVLDSNLYNQNQLVLYMYTTWMLAFCFNVSLLFVIHQNS